MKCQESALDKILVFLVGSNRIVYRTESDLVGFGPLDCPIISKKYLKSGLQDSVYFHFCEEKCKNAMKQTSAKVAWFNCSEHVLYSGSSKSVTPKSVTFFEK